MFEVTDYVNRGFNFVNNQLFPEKKRLSSLMIYATDLCDSACRHCLIWAKRPVTFLSLEAIQKIMDSKCVSSNTSIGLEGGEFLLHPEADSILSWFSRNHKNYDLFSNCLKPEILISAVERFKPKRLYISLDGDESTYLHMRGKDGYKNVIQVIERLKGKLPIFVMFTLSPYNDFSDLEHVAEICEEHKVFLRVGIYNNIPFFDTLENARGSQFGEHKNEEILSYKKATELKNQKSSVGALTEELEATPVNHKENNTAIPALIKKFKENYAYVRLYENWSTNKLRLRCFSILDSVIILPNGDVPICQNLPVHLGNIHVKSLDEIFNSKENSNLQKHYSQNCNQCWISYHRKYDIILYRNFEKFFGKWATSKMLGYYKWDEDENLSYNQAVEAP